MHGHTNGVALLFIPLLWPYYFHLVSAESSRTKKKSRFARKYSLVENRLKMATFIRLQGVASSIIGGLIFIYSSSHTIKNRFQKKLIVENTNIWTSAPYPITELATPWTLIDTKRQKYAITMHAHICIGI